MLTVSLSNDLSLVIESPGVALRGGRPVMNGIPLEGWICEWIDSEPDHIQLRYTSPDLGSTFGLLVVPPSAQETIWIQYWVEALPEDIVLDSFGLRFERVENLKQYLRSGYFSWDGSYYVQPDSMTDLKVRDPRLETGYGMCQLLPRYGKDCLILGFDRHDRFQQTFAFDTSRRPLSLTIQTFWDRKDRTRLERCQSERLAVFTHPEVENGLRQWAQLVASASPASPRLVSPPITGWCSWYNLYAYITEENILDHLHAAKTAAARESLPMRVFQIDDGFTPEMGDWLDV